MTWRNTDRYLTGWHFSRSSPGHRCNWQTELAREVATNQQQVIATREWHCREPVETPAGHWTHTGHRNTVGLTPHCTGFLLSGAEFHNKITSSSWPGIPVSASDTITASRQTYLNPQSTTAKGVIKTNLSNLCNDLKPPPFLNNSCFDFVHDWVWTRMFPFLKGITFYQRCLARTDSYRVLRQFRPCQRVPAEV